MTLRACIACPNTYHGPLNCPKCGEPGEPLTEYPMPWTLLDSRTPGHPAYTFRAIMRSIHSTRHHWAQKRDRHLYCEGIRRAAWFVALHNRNGRCCLDPVVIAYWARIQKAKLEAVLPKAPAAKTLPRCTWCGNLIQTEPVRGSIGKYCDGDHKQDHQEHVTD